MEVNVSHCFDEARFFEKKKEECRAKVDRRAKGACQKAAICFDSKDNTVETKLLVFLLCKNEWGLQK